ncbi:hypothetical protein HIM_04079 [Hirsutella minnesotensis 3608]|uniref:Thioredoxin n=1 Tax=Hirsutella minnesotensis 3608 TaxID=1043627 RepID=A0A0F7ZPZ3_9HYPO|nr:hypothetical protein HIM_04079 [Hirsutella minnesotensis 3608]
MPVLEITSKAAFDDLLKKHKHVVLQAHADWCGPCRVMSPILDKQAEEHGSDALAFAKFNIDSVPDLATEFGISSIPAFLFFADGEKVKDVVGANPPALTKAVGEFVA